MTDAPHGWEPLSWEMRNMRAPMNGLLTVIREAGNRGITGPEIFDRLYGWDVTGGPLSGANNLRVRISYLNRKRLRPMGWEIVNAEGHGRRAVGRYVLKKVTDPIPPAGLERMRLGVELTPKKLRLFDLIKSRAGITGNELARAIYHRADERTVATIRVHVSQMRGLFAGKVAIYGHHGNGYKMTEISHETGS